MNVKQENILKYSLMTIALIIMFIFILHVAKPFLLPVFFGAFISLLCGPLVNRLVRFGIPRVINVIAVLLGLVSCIVLSLNLLSEPAQQWWSKLPMLIQNVSNEVSEAAESSELGDKSDFTLGSTVANDGLTSNTSFSIIKSVLTTTPTIVTQLMVALFMAYFMMSYGRQIYSQSLSLFTRFSDKRKVVELVKVVQTDLSRYISSITIINVCLGVVVGCVFYMMGLKDPFLWGAFAGLMNYIPYLGPIVSVTCFALVSFLQFESLSYSLTVASLFLAINLIESQLATPTLLGKRFSLNPLILFVWLVFWGWLWGAMGMLMGGPLLVLINVILSKVSRPKLTT
ncbi:AI-2E family transporter [Vibrio sp. Isolate23]|uniref:AI-2E family transporter n=1 Tax=Vibrio sp. Isolate23 TaxID=2908533 RepID=UPI001EFD0954|nr:AI-2E family transporter [Vibrio sp. Isolate23]MCG9681622.1 AI-2E family transporter [Vibrio sp. Isolate23]